MTNQEIDNVVSYLNEVWPQKPIGPITAGLWGQELSRFSHAKVVAVLGALARTETWRPALATILKSLVVPSGGESSSEAFSSVWTAIGSTGGAGKPDISERSMRALKHLGGWADVCRTWTTEQMQWHRKEFMREFESLEARDADSDMRALGGEGTVDGRKALGAAVASVAEGLAK